MRERRDPRTLIATGIIIFLVILVGVGWIWGQLKTSLVFGNTHRFNLVVASTAGQVDFVSIDPVERQVFVLPFPANLAIRSRSVGEYQMNSLYKLGAYGGDGGEFVRRKVQGFMKVPIPGYVVVHDGSSTAVRGQMIRALFTPKANNVSTLDAVTLTARAESYIWKTATIDELMRAGVLEHTGDTYSYHPERLQQYVGTRLFDWGVGGAGVTVAVVNISGVAGLGNDIADFLTNLGLDVVAVRSADGQASKTTVTVAAHSPQTDAIIGMLKSLFGFATATQGSTSEYRAQIVVTVGTDAEGLF